MKNNTVLIINPIVSANYLAASLKKLGIYSIALYTYKKEAMHNYHIASEGSFDEIIFYNGNLLDDKNFIEKFLTIKYILNGADLSQNLTEELSQKLTPEFSNDPATSSLRMDKYLMHQCLSRHNLNFIQQFKYDLASNSLDEMKKIIKYPCFIKPLESAGSVGAKKIDDEKALEMYFSMEKSATFLPEIHHENVFLIGEFIEGTEYYVNTFSVRGVHHISTIQKYTKKKINGKPVCISIDGDIEDKVIGKITAYVKDVLTALNFNNGFAHIEVFYTLKEDVVLVEVNPRIGGASGACDHIAGLAGGFTQVELLAKYIFDKDLLLRGFKPESARVLFLYNFKNEPLPDMEKVLARKFQSVVDVKQVKPVGYQHQHDCQFNLLDATAIIMCKNDNIQQLKDDCSQILKLDCQM